MERDAFVTTCKMLPALLTVATLGFANAAVAQESQKLFFEGDIVRGNTPDGATGAVCVLANQFKRGENVIFRIRVRNSSGQPLDDKGIKSLTIEMMDGQKFPARFASRPPNGVLASVGLTAPSDYYWSAAWRLPHGFPSVPLTYKIGALDLSGNTPHSDT